MDALRGASRGMLPSRAGGTILMTMRMMGDNGDVYDEIEGGRKYGRTVGKSVWAESQR